MKRLIYYLGLLFLLIFINSCGGGGGGSNNSYTIDENKNHVLLGPIKGATISVYSLSNLKEPIATTTTDSKGGFIIKGLDGSDDDYFLVEVKGGEDIDANDDKILDDKATPLKTTLHALAKKADIENNRLNVTALSEITYQYLKDYFKTDPNMATISNDDLNKLIKIFAQSLVKAKDGDEAYKKLISYIPMDKNVDVLIDEENLDEFAKAMHNETKENEKRALVEKTAKFPVIPTDILDRLRIKALILFKKPPEGIEGLDIEGVTLKNGKFAFVDKNKRVDFKITSIENGYKILRWHGCDSVSSDKRECKVTALQNDRIVVPVVVPEIKKKDNVVIKDISNIVIDVNYTNANQSKVTIDKANLDLNQTALINSLHQNYILVHKQIALFKENKKIPVFFGKIEDIRDNSNNMLVGLKGESKDIFLLQ